MLHMCINSLIYYLLLYVVDNVSEVSWQDITQSGLQWSQQLWPTLKSIETRADMWKLKNSCITAVKAVANSLVSQSSHYFSCSGGRYTVLSTFYVQYMQENKHLVIPILFCDTYSTHTVHVYISI